MAGLSCVLAQHSHPDGAKDAGPAPILKGLGNLHHKVTTSKPEAQRYFDQGLTLIYAFNHEEAARSFRYAAKLDPKCAMAFWGEALAVGPNYNDPDIDMSREKAAVDAINKALAVAGQTSENEQGYIHALAKRYSADPKADRKKLGVAYQQAMRDLMKRYPDDLDAAVLFAESSMDLHPWLLWKPNGQPEEGTVEIVDVLKGVLQRDPNHIGANHFYVHATEAGPHPADASASAERLKTLAPAAGHLVHMPAHTFIRVGDYHGATIANEKAAVVDEAYIKKYKAGTTMYAVMYYSHNLHFLAISSSMEGTFAKAHQSAAQVVKGMTPMAKENPMAEWFLPTLGNILVRFHRWDEILKLPEPDKNLHLMHAFWHFARGMAFSATGKAGAGTERDALAAETKAIPAEAPLGMNTAHKVLDIAALMLDANIARAKHDLKQTAALLTKAARADDALNYDEPPDWYLPPRETLGAVLLEDKRAAEAEKVFRDELKAHPKNPRALFGLAESLAAQGKKDEAAKVRKDFEAGWKYADVKLQMADL